MLSWFQRHKTGDPPADLREQLFRAVQKQDFKAAGQLVDRYREAIRSGFAVWRKPPETLRGNAVELEQWARTLHTIAKVFDRQGDPSLLASITGGPFQQWDDAMKEAGRLANNDAPERAIEILDALLTEIEQVEGNVADHYRPMVLGGKGIALFRAGKRNEAIALTTQALRLCEANGDQEGIKAYTNNLRALGTFEVSTAAGPRGLVIEDESGATLTPDEFRQHKGRIKWQVVGGPDVPAEARRLQQEGRTAGERKEFDLAVQLFTEAATVDPSWPQPLYDRAFTHLLKGDRTAALDDYQAVMALAPDGFFGTRQFIDLLAREMSGELPEGFAVSFDSIQWLPAEQQAHVLAQLVERFPSCAVAWCEWSRHESNLERRLEILDKGLSANGDPDTRATLRVNKGAVLINLGQSEAGKALLVSEANGASAAGRAMAEIFLQHGEHGASGTGGTVT